MITTKTPVLKDVYTNSLYQSTFLPIFEKAETKIKELIFAAFLFGRSKYFLFLAIAQVILDVDKKIPRDLHDRDQYLNGLRVKSNYMVAQYYEKPTAYFQTVKEQILSSVPSGERAPVLNNPKEVLNLIDSKKMWSEAKGNPNVVLYPKEVRLRLNQLANETITTQEPRKRPISLWQKAELDVRYENQMQNVQNLRVSGVKYAWLSSHPNCSKRCAAWQGELVVLEGHAPSPQKVVNYKTFSYKKSTFAVGKVDGHTVYSLSDIMDVVDNKYGYHNNIISGFNCRHRLIPYTGQLPPKEYTEEEIKKQREIESKIREIERTIRLKKQQLKLYNELGDKKAVAALKNEIKRLTDHYKAYCEKNGYAWHQFRIEV